MFPVSQRFLSSVNAGHKLVTRITAQTVSGETIVTEDLLHGTVSINRGSNIRRSLHIAFAGEEYVPQFLTDTMMPYGTELIVERGIRWPNGDEEFVPLGIFRVNDLDIINNSEEFTVSVIGFDRMKVIEDSRFSTTHRVASGTIAEDEIMELISDVLPGTQFRFMDVGAELPELIEDEGGSRSDFAIGIAVALGADLYFNYDGELILEPEPSPIGGPDVTIEEGHNLISIQRRITRQGIVNHWVVLGESTGLDNADQPRAEARDDNPSSPTYWAGNFGHVVDLFPSEYILTNSQAQDVANSLLMKHLGTPQQLDIESLVNPAIVPGDIVRVVREKVGVSNDYVLDQVNVSLDPETPMSLQTRLTQEIEIG